MANVTINPHIVSDVQIAISKQLETSINTPYVTASDFESALVAMIPPHIPVPETIDDLDQVGDGTEYARQILNYYWGQPSIQIQCPLNCELAARLTKRFLAGTVTDTLVSTGVYDHKVIMQTRQQGVTPQPSTLALINGGADIINSSMFVDQITVTQQMSGRPQFQAVLMGTGYYKRVRDVYRAQTVTITGAPTGGTFTLTFKLNGVSYTTANIAYNANAAAVASAIITAASLVSGDLVGSGGALPTTAVTLTAPSTSNIYEDEIGLMTADGALLTGGTSPAVAVTTTSPVLVLPDPPRYHYMHGAALEAVTSDGASIDLTTLGLLQYTLTFRQNISVLRLPGDSFMNPSNIFSGAYPNFVRRGKREATNISLKLMLGDNLPEFRWLKKNLDLTDLLFTNHGEKIGSTAYDHRFVLDVPFSKVRTLVADSEGDLASKSVNFTPTKDPTSLGILTATIRNGTATLV